MLFISVSATANTVAVVVNPENQSLLNRSEIRKIFLGKEKAFSNGKTVSAYDLPEGNDNRALFVDKVLNKNESRLNAYWARMLFSSRAKPPKTVASAERIKEIISENINAIAYMNKDDVDDSVKVVYTFSE